MPHSFISWLMRPVNWFFWFIGADRLPEEAVEEKKPVALITKSGKPVSFVQPVATVRPFWRKLNDAVNKRALRRKRGRQSRKAWRRP